MSVAFIVSSRGRPRELASCLASLALQDDPKEILVCTTNENRDKMPGVRYWCKEFGAQLLDTRAPNMYIATQQAIMETKREWLCFPNDDAYLVPQYSRIMLREAELNKWDLVYTDCVYDPRMNKRYYMVYEVQPAACRIDKICYMVRRTKFYGFPMIDHPQYWTMCDGFLVHQLVKEGVAHGHVPGPMCVHS